jgi:two-component system, NarL family, nitrate/nitrite response regulator NarL
VSALVAGSRDSVIRILIVTDVCLFSEGLSRVLGGRPDLEVVGSSSPSDEVIGSIATCCPDVVLIDAATVHTSELALRLTGTAARCAARVVAFAIAEEDEDEVLACAEAGVAGFVSRNATLEQLIAVLHGAVRGEILCPPQVTAVIFRQVARLAAFRSVTPDERGLTQRETEIGGLIETGLSNKEIARRLGIEQSTVKNHVHSLLDKLHVSRRAEAAALMRSQHRWAARLPAGT